MKHHGILSFQRTQPVLRASALLALLMVPLAALPNPAGTPAQPGRWASTPEGVLDREQSLYWTRQDNGADIDWNRAGSWCQSLGAGWRLPTEKEIDSLQAGAAGETVPCRNARCKVPALFTLSSYWVWTSQLNTQGEALYAYLHVGHKQYAKPDYQLNARALCVRPA